MAPWASSYRSVPGVLGPPGSGVLSSCVRPTSGGELSAAAAEEAELKPTACRKKIRSLRDLSSWTASHSHKEYIRFLKRLSGAVSDRKAVCRAPQLPAGGVQASDGAAHDNAPCARTPENRARALAARLAGEPGNEDLHPVSDSVIGVLKLLLQLSDWIDEVPPVEQPMRFGNRAFRTWHQRMKEVRGRLAVRGNDHAIPLLASVFVISRQDLSAAPTGMSFVVPVVTAVSLSPLSRLTTSGRLVHSPLSSEVFFRFLVPDRRHCLPPRCICARWFS